MHYFESIHTLVGTVGNSQFYLTTGTVLFSIAREWIYGFLLDRQLPPTPTSLTIPSFYCSCCSYRIIYYIYR
jgi:hypothetical protein